MSLILILVIELGLGFIPCDKYKEWNSIAVILSSGYLGSYIVYFLTIVIPECKDRKRTIPTGQVSESLDSTWQLCAVGHGSHSPRAAPEHVRQAGANLDVEITQDFKTRSEKRTSNSLLVFKKV